MNEKQSQPDSKTAPKAGNLAVTLATWLFILEDAGHSIESPTIREAIHALREAGESEADHRGKALVAQIEDELGEDPDYEHVLAFLRSLLGQASIEGGFGADREERLRHIRSYEFRTSLPWIARIIDRFPDGSVGSHWVMVERVTDRVTCMDPYPWDELDEEYALPVIEFMVKWELAGCDALAWKA